MNAVIPNCHRGSMPAPMTVRTRRTAVAITFAPTTASQVRHRNRTRRPRSHPPRQLPHTPPNQDLPWSIDGWQPIAPQEAVQTVSQPSKSESFPHVRSAQTEQQAAPRIEAPARYLDSTLNQGVSAAHPQPVSPSSSSRVPNGPVVSAPSWDSPTTVFPAESAVATDTRGSRLADGYNARPRSPRNRVHTLPSISSLLSTGQTQSHSSVQSAGGLGSAPAVGPHGQQQHHNGVPPQVQTIRPRQVNTGIPADFRSSTPPKRTIDDLDIIRRAKRPPAKGFRRFLFKLTGGKVNPGQSQAELEYLELVKRINQPSRGVYKIAFVSLKAGWEKQLPRKLWARPSPRCAATA